MSKVVCIGEAIVDFIPRDDRFVACAGGAPANVCVGVVKLGTKSCYLGNISTDAYGFFLYDNLQRYGVDMCFVSRDDKHMTPLSFVSLSNGERSFEFKREDTVDLNLSENDIKKSMFEKGDILHFCSVSLVDGPTKHAHEKAIALAKENGALVSFDINIRENLWDDRAKMFETICEFLKDADVVKMTDDELFSISTYIDGVRHEDECTAVSTIFSTADCCKVLFITKGEKGASLYTPRGDEIHKQAYPSKVVDTTGAGDCFVASILHSLCEAQCADSSEIFAVSKEAFDFALCSCSIVVERYGAQCAMPTKNEVERRLKLL